MIDRIISDLKKPDKEFSPIPFWFLNDKLEKSELRRQLEDFNEKGVNGVVLHPRIGLPDDFEYLSEDYFDIFKFIVKTAKKLDMRIVLYDEAMYPSGSAHGGVVRHNPDFASVGICLAKNRSDGKVIAELPNGYFIVSKKCGGTIRGIHYGEDDGEASAPLSADILNPKAVDKFIELTHERYYSHLSEYFGNTITGFFTDEPCILGRGADGFFEWTEGLENDILSRGGKLEELGGLFNGQENSTTEIYRQLITERLNNTYYLKLSQWCEAHGVSLMGHPKESDDIDEQKYFHIPGQDLVFRWVSPESGAITGVHSVQAKCTSDFARHTGRRRNSNECFGVCSREGIPWYLTAGDMKWFIDWLGVRGVNMFIPHAFYYSVEGKRKDERPPDAGPNNIWWEHYRYFSDYMKRISYIMTDSVNCAKTAVLCKSGAMNTARDFYENQIEFNYLPYSLLDNAEVTDGQLCIAGYKYKYIAGENDFGIRAIKSADEVIERDFSADKHVRKLRVSHLIKYGVHMYFIVNEGMDSINTHAELKVKAVPAVMNLWSGEVFGIPFEETEAGVRIQLSLKKYESMLILLDSKEGKYPPMPERTRIDGLDFAMTEQDGENFVKTYTAEYIKNSNTKNEYFEISCEEMAECYVNGKFCGVSFFNHSFDIGDCLKEGKNTITLRITGSIANKYSDKDIPYGLYTI